jgi:hypothetical protein
VPNKKIVTLFVFFLALSLYVYTLLPSLAWGDGVKLQSEAIAGESFVLAEMPPDKFIPDPFPFSRVGVAAWDHPLYIVVGHLLVRALSFVDPLWLINFLSAFFGAASVALVFLLGMRFTASIFASLYASLSLAVAHTFWWHSSTPEVYTLFVFLFLLSFYFFDRFERTGKQKSLVASAFFLGLAACTHVLAFLAVPALGLYYIFSGAYRNFRLSDSRKLVPPALGFLAGFSLYIVQFIRMSANFPLNEIMGPVVGTTFLSQLGTFSPVLLGESLLSYLFFLTVQFGPLGLILGGLGMRRVFKLKEPLLLKIVFAFLVFALFGIFYRVTDQFTFFIASYVFWALLMGLGADIALGLLPLKWRFPVPVMLGVLLLATPFFYVSLPGLAAKAGLNDASLGIPEIGVGLRNGLAYYIDPNKRGDSSPYEFGYQTVSHLAPGALVIAEWYTDTDEYFILRYFTRIAKLRSDVTIAGWPAEDPFSFDSGLVLALIDDSLPERPVYLASLSDKFYAASELVEAYCVVPENNLYRLYPKDSTTFQCLGMDAVTE